MHFDDARMSSKRFASEQLQYEEELESLSEIAIPKPKGYAKPW